MTSKICILRCKEKDLVYNLKMLCDNCVQTIAQGSAIVAKGRHFYFPIANFDEVKNLKLKGKIIKE